MLPRIFYYLHEDSYKFLDDYSIEICLNFLKLIFWHFMPQVMLFFVEKENLNNSKGLEISKRLKVPGWQNRYKFYSAA